MQILYKKLLSIKIKFMVLLLINYKCNGNILEILKIK